LQSFTGFVKRVSSRYVPTDAEDDAERLHETAAALDRIIEEAQRTKVLVESRLRAIRQAGCPSPAIERRKPPRKVR
jgi:hypothetical protein